MFVRRSILCQRHGFEFAGLCRSHKVRIREGIEDSQLFYCVFSHLSIRCPLPSSYDHVSKDVELVTRPTMVVARTPFPEIPSLYPGTAASEIGPSDSICLGSYLKL